MPFISYSMNASPRWATPASYWERGRFAFNTAFFEGAVPARSLAFYKKLMLKTVRILRNDYGAWRDEALCGHHRR